MLLLVTIVLVLVAAVTLLIGIFSDNLPLIFLSIGASFAAAVVLGILSQMSRRKGKAAAAATAPSPLPEKEATSTPAPEPTAATVAAGEAPTTSMQAVSAASADGLPIDDYEALRVNQILPLLDDLDLDELETVAQFEETHKNRSTVLNRIDQRMDVLEDAEGLPDGAETSADDETAAAISEVDQPVIDDDDGFPIPNFDDLDEDELLPLLADLDADQLETVADREEANQNRDAVLDAIDDRLDILEGIVAAPVKKAPAKKSPAKKVPAKKVPAKKVSAAKSAAAPRKAATPAKRVPATKATKKVTGTTRKAVPVRAAATRATTVKKSAPVKKATAARKATATKKATRR